MPSSRPSTTPRHGSVDSQPSCPLSQHNSTARVSQLVSYPVSSLSSPHLNSMARVSQSDTFSYPAHYFSSLSATLDDTVQPDKLCSGMTWPVRKLSSVDLLICVSIAHFLYLSSGIFIKTMHHQVCSHAYVSLHHLHISLYYWLFRSREVIH